jgi:hypothetical protein
MGSIQEFFVNKVDEIQLGLLVSSEGVRLLVKGES